MTPCMLYCRLSPFSNGTSQTGTHLLSNFMNRYDPYLFHLLAARQYPLSFLTTMLILPSESLPTTVYLLNNFEDIWHSV